MTACRCTPRSTLSSATSKAARAAQGSRAVSVRAMAAPSGPFDDRGHAHAAGGADRNESAAGAAFLQQFRERRDDARAGRGERMAESERGAVHVEFRGVDAAERLVLAEPVVAIVGVFPGAQRAE